MDGIECIALHVRAATSERVIRVLGGVWHGDAFLRRVKEAEGDAARLLDLLAEAVDRLQTVRVAYQAARMRDAEKE